MGNGRINKNEPGNAFWHSTGWTKRDDIFVYSRNLEDIES